MAWVNNDGLVVLFDKEEATDAKAGELPSSGAYRTVQVVIPDLTVLGTASTLLDDFVSIPDNARIAKVTVITDTAVTSGGSAVLNIGLLKLDRSTAIDADGLVAALPIASFNAAGETVALTAGVTYGGALLGTTITDAGLLYADYDTAAFTAGAIRVLIDFYIP
jgi:hypothetical protein